ncbi:MAG: sulfite exporter TauE/SafE family protein [Thalassovita sp.]|nr:sulfite exporter TauE/SafE family protein [Thalassovita sp.]
METADLILIGLAFAAGGIIKGAVGAGAPLLAVPLMVLLRDVQFAVAVFVLPNIIPNLLQFLQYRRAIDTPRFTFTFALAGGIGAGLGTVALAGWRPDLLMLMVAVALVSYIAFRLARPAWQMPKPLASKLALPVGIVAGALQGASGLSAPVSLTFLNAIRFERDMFVATVSLYFIALGVAQLPVQIAYGIMTTERFAYSALSLIPLIGFMPVGAWIGRRLSREVFDQLILLILVVLAIKIIFDALT